MTGSHLERKKVIFTGNHQESCQGLLPVEVGARLSVNGIEWLSFHCTPESLQELAIGYLFGEGFIAQINEVVTFMINPLFHIDVWLDHAIERPERWQRTSDCQGGILLSGMPVPQVSPFESKSIGEIYKNIQEFLGGLSKTAPMQKGMHSSSLFESGILRRQFKDIGRQNTIDKIAGWKIIEKRNILESCIITTGRLTTEMVSKCARMNIPLVISLHSATTAAIDLGEKVGMCLVGHARPNQLVIYAHPERIVV